MKRACLHPLLTVAMLALLLATAGRAVAAPPGFVTAVGPDFVVDQRIWRPIGADQYRLTSMPGGFVCDGSYGPITDDSLGQRLDQMAAAGANVVRTWFFQRYWQQGPVADPWQPFDRLLAAAAARGMKVIPVLANHWSDCEWSPGKNHGFYAQAYRSPGFGYQSSYRDWAVTVAARYVANPAVAFWQLINEAEASFCTDMSVRCTPATNATYQCPSDAATVLRQFADDMTTRIKAVDANHLVSLGTIGSGQCGASGDEYRYIHAGAVDVCEAHDYDHAELALPGDAFNGVSVRMSQCNALGKPIFVGEVGIRADVGPAGASTGSITPATLARRANFLDAKIAAQFAGGMDGFLIWERIVEASDSLYNQAGERYGIGPGDPVDAVLRAWQGTSPVVVTGFSWSSDGAFERSGPSGTVVTAFGTSLRMTTFRLVSAPQAGNESEACRYNAVPMNPAIRFANSRGFVANTSGQINRPAGVWQICLRSTDGRYAGLPIYFTVP